MGADLATGPGESSTISSAMADRAGWRTRAARSFAFARHIPPTKMARRVMLAGRRQIEQCLQQAMDMGAREQQSKRIPMRKVR